MPTLAAPPSPSVARTTGEPPRPALGSAAPIRRAIAKLSFDPRTDKRIIGALSAYPDRRHSAMLAAWLRAGWRVATGRAVAPPVVAAAPATTSALQGAELARQATRPMIRRVFVDAAAEPGLDDFLRGLPRHERGREIRHFILVALGRAASPRGPQVASQRPTAVAPTAAP
ncbi:MAG TPA: hypothetical protein VMU33_05515 [Burkholderiaceae bacterium]|nr:hypothetical protein [Burkholderiaceae bacterium]